MTVCGSLPMAHDDGRRECIQSLVIKVTSRCNYRHADGHGTHHIVATADVMLRERFERI